MEIKDKEIHQLAATAIIYNDKGKYLITRRSLQEKAFPGMWTVPGGKLSTDDYVNEKPDTKMGQWYNAIQTSLRREIKEEVNLEVGKLTFLLDIAGIIPGGRSLVILSHYAPYVSGEVAYDEDTIDSAWVTLEEAKKYDLIDGIWHELEMVEHIVNK